MRTPHGCFQSCGLAGLAMWFPVASMSWRGTDSPRPILVLTSRLPEAAYLDFIATRLPLDSTQALQRHSGWLRSAQTHLRGELVVHWYGIQRWSTDDIMAKAFTVIMACLSGPSSFFMVGHDAGRSRYPVAPWWCLIAIGHEQPRRCREPSPVCWPPASLGTT